MYAYLDILDTVLPPTKEIIFTIEPSFVIEDECFLRVYNANTEYETNLRKLQLLLMLLHIYNYFDMYNKLFNSLFVYVECLNVTSEENLNTTTIIYNVNDNTEADS